MNNIEKCVKIGDGIRIVHVTDEAMLKNAIARFKPDVLFFDTRFWGAATPHKISEYVESCAASCRIAVFNFQEMPPKHKAQFLLYGISNVVDVLTDDNWENGLATILRGSVYVSESVNDAAKEITTMPPENFALTKREAQVLALRAEGKNGREIAETLNIAHGTVRNFYCNIRGKSGLTEWYDIFNWATEMGILAVNCNGFYKGTQTGGKQC
jgi:DNA-binding NarL/FixJ family response regulator